MMRAAGGTSASEARPPPQPTSSTDPSGGSTSRSNGVDAVLTGSLALHGEVVRQARPRRLRGLGEDLVGDLPGRQLLGPPRRRVADRVHRAIMPGDGDALRHRLGGARRRTARGPRHRPRLRRAGRGGSTTSGPPASPAALTAAGLGPDSKVGLYLYNSNEYLEAQFGGFKARAVPVNVNYRYLDDELAYLLDNADAEALVFHTSLGDRVARVRSRLPRLRLLVGGGRRPAGGRHAPSTAPCRGRTRSPRTRRWSASLAARTTSTCSTPAAPPACPRASCTRWVG